MIPFVIACVQFFSGVLALLIAIGRLLAPRRTDNRLLAGLFTVYGLILINSACGPSGLTVRFPVLFRLSYPLPFLFGPLFYLYARSMRDLNFEFRKPFLFHFVPFLVACAVMTDYYAADLATKRLAVEAVIVRGELHWREFFFGSGLIVTLGYVIAVAVESRLFFSPRILREEPSVRFYVFGIVSYLFYFAAITPSGVFNNKGLYFTASLLFALAIPAGFLCAQRYPDFFEGTGTQAAFQKYRRRLLSPDEEEGLGTRLENLMRAEKAFRDPRLTVARTARLLETTAPALSQLINGRFGKNFNEYLNEHRLSEVRERLLTSDETILAIALEAGFNSKNAFNEAFRKSFAMSPREFRRTNDGKIPDGSA